MQPTAQPPCCLVPSQRPLACVPVSSTSGSALVLVLLITALLATVAVSFLSTSRIEQIAAKNFTRQNAAASLAEMATQQAMAKIQQGFTVTGNGTTVITTQPGAIWQHTFSSGTCNAVSGKNPVELFSNNGTINANLNNLQNPSSNSSASSNRWTITGNASEQINVPMENITSNGTIIGRIAYYVDDEGSKLNVNNAVGNRTALNAALRPLDIAALSANYTNIFASIVNGAGPSNTSNVTTWSHFFRPDQVGAAINSAGGNFSTENLPYITTATSSTNSAANITHLLTPWGTQRIDINTLSTNAADGTGDASVSTIHAALTNSTLSAIFGSDFGTKYTSVGVKQIAANMLQLRNPNTFSVNASFSYNGSVLHDTLGTTGLYRNLPTNYSANTPFPVVNEIAATAAYRDLDTRMRLVITFWIELYNPYNIDYLNTTNASVCFMLDKIQFQTTATGNTFVGVNQGYYNYQTTNQHDYYTSSNENDANILLSSIRGEPKIKIPNIQSRATETIRVEFFTHWWRVSRGGNVYPGISDGSNTNSITGDITVGFERIAVLANNNDPNSIRDGISGNDIGSYNITTSDIYKVDSINANNRLPQPGSTSVKRIDPRIKATANGGATNSVIITTNNTITKNGSASQDNIVPAPDSTSGNVVPGDPILSNNSTYLLTSNSSADKLPPVLDFPAFSSPADLGKVPTNTLYRSLRMQVQPAIEGARIPDWAMLDVISFGNSSNSNLPYNRFQPVNINAIKFHLPGNASVAPRTIGIQSLVNGLAANGEIQNPMELTQTTPVDVTRFKGSTPNGTDIANIVNAIRDMTWSSSSSWDTRRNALRFPSDQYILPSEIIEIAGVADAVDAVSPAAYNNSTSHFKWNEGRASAIIPAVTTRSSFFTIYAYAQAGQLQDKNQPESASNPFIIDSEALTRTLVEVEVETPATATDPAVYKVKKLYTQPIPLGQ